MPIDRMPMDKEISVVINVPGCRCIERTQKQLERADVCDACVSYFDLEPAPGLAELAELEKRTEPIHEDRIRFALDQVLRGAVTAGVIDKAARLHIFTELDQAIVEANVRDVVRAAAVEARDMLMDGCRTNGGWLGIETMKAHDILKRVVGDDHQEGLD